MGVCCISFQYSRVEKEYQINAINGKNFIKDAAALAKLSYSNAPVYAKV